jgi:hypothetical protein
VEKTVKAIVEKIDVKPVEVIAKKPVEVKP